MDQPTFQNKQIADIITHYEAEYLAQNLYPIVIEEYASPK